MRLLRVDGGVHGGVHRQHLRAVQREVDLQAVTRGGEGQDRAVRAAGEHGGDPAAECKLAEIDAEQPHQDSSDERLSIGPVRQLYPELVAG
ncbi:hypothetical protein RJ640_000469 [Escallonia rubra]|uniref:Uncharacterized protein n=1 Tax=Escallonia rubra TaxID=112253 RepID=A0AA88RUS9_9ASTE|nr:hypothetical protein RJ640_000469 [Escallonia rubra]